jgi:DNA-directed RNA polymerases I, II, and III subunit RPABC1
MNANVRVTLHEMLKDRGYDRIVSEDDVTIVAKRTSSNDRNVLVYFIYDAKVSVKRVKTIKEMIDNDNDIEYECLILVYKTAITTFAKQFITTDVNNLFVQAFSERELSFNVTKHHLVPKHVVLTPEEKRGVVKKYRTAMKHFPLMLSSDPVARYYGLLPGAMVKITRPSPTAGEYTLYRVVV